MPGMNSGLNVSDPTVVAAFEAVLLHQGLIALLIFFMVGLAWLSLRAWLMVATGGTAAAMVKPEPAWRQVLRTGFGIIWLFDGILQAQPKMPVGLPSQVIEPTAASSPHWVQAVVNWAGTAWSFHPLQAGAAAVWIQVGIGIWLLVAARGPLSRIAGLVSVGWSLVVWVFGESFGGIFAPGLTWLFGAPGAVLVYGIAGALIALPDRIWHNRRLGQAVLGGLGLFLLGMAVLQAWPGRGFWQGTAHGQPGTLAGMTSSMVPTPQPHILSAWITAFTGFDEAHGFAVNLFAVAALAVTGAAFLSGRRRLIGPVLAGFIVLCLADWVLIEDFGFFGGLGTDPNSMLPFALLAAGGYLALASAPAPDRAAATEAAGTGGAEASWRHRIRLAATPQALASSGISSVAAIGAIGVIILGAAPMAAAQANPVADTILAQAIDGSSAPLNYPASGFSLTDQNGRPVTLASLRGKVVLLGFLDPVCTVDCPLMGQEFRQASQLLAADTSHVELVAVNYNPLDTQAGYLQAFDRQEGLNTVSNWLYLTGTRTQLQQVWHAYGLPVEILPAGSMIGHGDYAFVIDQNGHLRRELDFDPGPGTQATKSSFAAELTDAARQLLGQS
ncbi:MAG TPA: SCO family protein [Streptosporangiaceae bacterium]|jgi:cytochrome oxidase Cu insertion factor (SCO1/SenC/PrrC family)|nr:SCO family protein [Streptosporangiaceae bacterium]